MKLDITSIVFCHILISADEEKRIWKLVKKRRKMSDSRNGIKGEGRKNDGDTILKLQDNNLSVASRLPPSNKRLKS